MNVNYVLLEGCLSPPTHRWVCITATHSILGSALSRTLIANTDTHMYLMCINTDRYTCMYLTCIK